jgi:hypothetical protein
MLTETRSDLLITISHLDKMTNNEKDELIKKLHYKIENAHSVCLALERDHHFMAIGQLLRKALES